MLEHDSFMEIPEYATLVGVMVDALSGIPIDDHDAQEVVKGAFTRYLKDAQPYGPQVCHATVAQIAHARALDIREELAVFSQSVSSEKFND